jgi:hypothetical protein
MDRQATFLWMRDLLEHLSALHDQWETCDGQNDTYVGNMMCRELDELRRACENLRRAGGTPRIRNRQAVAA